MVSAECSFRSSTIPISGICTSYVSLPSVFQLRCTLLDKPLAENNATVDGVVKTASSQKQGVFCLEGWSNVKKEKVMNVLIKVLSKTCFISSLATTHEKVDAEFMARHLVDAVNDFSGVEYVHSIVSNNASSCVKATRLGAEISPGIMPLQAIPHAHEGPRRCIHHCS